MTKLKSDACVHGFYVSTCVLSTSLQKGTPITINMIVLVACANGRYVRLGLLRERHMLYGWDDHTQPNITKTSSCNVYTLVQVPRYHLEVFCNPNTRSSLCMIVMRCHHILIATLNHTITYI